MRCFASTHFVNRSAEGKSRPLTARQLYDGLRIKARDPKEFVPVIQECKVISENETELFREVKFKGKPEYVWEHVEYFEPMTVTYTMLALDGEVRARITNLISTTPDGELLLTFTFAMGKPGEKDDAAANKDAKIILDGADKAIKQTIKKIRKLVKEGKIQ